MSKTRNTLVALLRDLPPRTFEVEFWNGETWPVDGDLPTEFTLTLAHPGSLRSMLLPLNDRTFGEAYVVGDIDLRGDLVAAMRVAYDIIETRRPLPERAAQALRLLALPSPADRRPTELRARLSGRQHSKPRDRQANEFHYSRSNALYQLLLDEAMAYTCGYFAGSDDSLDDAQRQKFDHVCRKLRLSPGDRLLDIGCGWGGLAIHAATNYNVTVRGLTISSAQAELATERIAAAGLSDRCTIELRDFRDLTASEQYDKVAAIGLVEHLGPMLSRVYFAKAWELLKPGGVLLHHGMTTKAREPMGSPFLESYVFPDAELMTLGETARLAEDAGFEIVDVESLRRHYARTIRCWRERLDAKAPEAEELIGVRGVRVYRIYFAGLEYAYLRGRINLHQMLLVKSVKGQSSLPMTREDWYR